MNIDITDLSSERIIRILTSFPRGNLEIKFERVFWVSEEVEPQGHNRSIPPRGGMAPRNSLEEASQRFKRAADTLGSLMGP